MVTHLLERLGNQVLLEDIKEDGIGSEYWRQFQAGRTVNPVEFIRWQFSESKGNNAIEVLEE